MYVVCVCLYCSIIAIHSMYRPVITCIYESVFTFDNVLFNYNMSHATPIIYMTLYLSKLVHHNMYNLFTSVYVYNSV